MKYIIGKMTAGEFIEQFEDVIRNFENSFGTTPLPENETRDAFYNAAMVSVPQVQIVAFIQNSTHQQSVPYDQLKIIVLQDEAMRNQERGVTQVRSANFVDKSGTRCFDCQSYVI